MSKPSSVKVPVLSKHIMFIFPQMFIFEGAIQKIYDFLSLTIANPIPIDIHVGSAGGTVTVSMSRLLSIILAVETFP